MTIPLITPADARRRLNEGSAVLIDIREPQEHAREAIPGSKLCPLSRFEPAALAALTGHASTVIFHCQGGKRTEDNASRLKACNAPEAYILKGGLAGWKSAGYPTRLDRTQPIEMQRQVQIAAGTLVLLGLSLSWLVSPPFIVLSAFVGTGLIFAGVSGWCGMARLLAVMPWNRKTA